jgi:hypothetical protein
MPFQAATQHIQKITEWIDIVKLKNLVSFKNSLKIHALLAQSSIKAISFHKILQSLPKRFFLHWIKNNPSIL